MALGLWTYGFLLPPLVGPLSPCSLKLCFISEIHMTKWPGGFPGHTLRAVWEIPWLAGVMCCNERIRMHHWRVSEAVQDFFVVHGGPGASPSPRGPMGVPKWSPRIPGGPGDCQGSRGI